MAIPYCIDVESHLPADAEAVWRRVATAEGINSELWPIHMRLPANQDLQAESLLARSQGVLISLFGVVPLDWHRLQLESVEPGRGFREASTSLWMRRWIHVRTLEAQDSSCVLRDHVELTPRIALLAPLMAPLYRAIFRRRHRALRRYFGNPQTSAC